MCSRINTLSAKIFRASRSCWTPSPCKKENKTNVGMCCRTGFLSIMLLPQHQTLQCGCLKMKRCKRGDNLSRRAGEIPVQRAPHAHSGCSLLSLSPSVWAWRAKEMLGSISGIESREVRTPTLCTCSLVSSGSLSLSRWEGQ